MKPLRLILCVASRTAIRRRSSAAATAPPTAAGCPFHPPQEAAGSLTGNVKPFEAIPTPRKLPIIGTLLDIYKSGGASKMHEYCHRRHLELGPIFRERLGTVDAVVISKKEYIEKVYFSEGRYPQHLIPEAWQLFNEMWGIKRGLFFMEGEQWLKTREKLNPVMMSRKEVYKFGDKFNEIIDYHIARWNEECQKRDDFVLPQMEFRLYDYNIDSLGSYLFGDRILDDMSPEMKKEYDDFVTHIRQIFITSAKLSMIPPAFAAKWNLAPWREFCEATKAAMEFARKMVRARIESYNTTDKYNNKGILDHLLDQNEFSEDEITSIITDLLLAAADTSSHAAQWNFYELARHPEIQEKLYREIMAATNGEMATVEHLDKIPYVSYIINETLRMYPIATFLTRILPHPIVLGGYEVPPGKLILMSQYTVGRDPERFPNPDEFNPDRWRKTGPRSGNTAHCCLPFGIGVRGCVGRTLAEVNLKLLIVRTVQQYRLKAMNKEKVGISLRLITTPDQEIEIAFHKRET